MPGRRQGGGADCLWDASTVSSAVSGLHYGTLEWTRNCLHEYGTRLIVNLFGRNVNDSWRKDTNVRIMALMRVEQSVERILECLFV